VFKAAYSRYRKLDHTAIGRNQADPVANNFVALGPKAETCVQQSVFSRRQGRDAQRQGRQ
jgi:hypothetical protein